MEKQYSQLIQTKLSVPKLRSRIIDRRRLAERATTEPGVVLTLVSAPAGYGKTTLMAALSMVGRADGNSLVSRFGGGNRYLVEYLLQEVFERQPADIQRFLLSTSVLERLCGPLCDAVLGGQSRSVAILRQLEQAKLTQRIAPDRWRQL